ncbi:DUF1918 domain-containing protein [Actinocrinis puniceicyclus]|uniref:DUF1918 domain-containing protein n=1 Tax=Actinocrinis puniceicyclus TaxID=977794 RepID=A0A8J7WTQ9_9ACTN|nr:DUF1918 domain-containing protein [Actinocrinis puniceicyclus]MBS2965984.1 DUF1918 domain-containing protein [Actinocrinis puniceicyclus]
MRASIGDRLHIHTNHVGVEDQYGRIVEIRGANGAPPYLVEFPDGHTSLVFPGPDAVIEPGNQAHKTARGVRPSRRVHTRAGW